MLVSWNTKNELEFIENLATSYTWGLIMPSISDRKKAIETWLRTSLVREWPKKFGLQVCTKSAQEYLQLLQDMKRN